MYTLWTRAQVQYNDRKIINLNCVDLAKHVGSVSFGKALVCVIIIMIIISAKSLAPRKNQYKNPVQIVQSH